MASALGDPVLEALLERLHAQSDAQLEPTQAYFAQRARNGALPRRRRARGLRADRHLGRRAAALQLLAPALRPGAIVACDNTAAHPDYYRDYFAFVNDPANRLRTQTLPFAGGLELSVRI